MVWRFLSSYSIYESSRSAIHNAGHDRLTLRRPFNIESVEAHRQAIFCRGERPQLYNSSIPMALQDLLENCWDGNIAQRYSMHEAVIRLEDILYDSNQPAPLSRVDSSFDICLATASSFLWDSLETLWNYVLKDFQTGGSNDECRDSNILDSCMVHDSKLHVETVFDKCKPFNSPGPPDFNNQPESSSSGLNDNDNDSIKPQEGTTVHNINDQQEQPSGKKVDRFYKDRLLRSIIHCAHGTHQSVVGPAPPNQVVSPSA
jgi:hypothetical protein